MNYAKNMTAVLSVALLFSSVSMVGISAPAWMNRDNAKAAGWGFLRWTPVLALTGYCVHLTRQIQVLQKRKHDHAVDVAGHLVKDREFITNVGTQAAPILAQNQTFVGAVATATGIKDGLFVTEQAREQLMGVVTSPRGMDHIVNGLFHHAQYQAAYDRMPKSDVVSLVELNLKR